LGFGFGAEPAFALDGVDLGLLVVFLAGYVIDFGNGSGANVTFAEAGGRGCDAALGAGGRYVDKGAVFEKD
jgi:hypothetical protein